MGAAASSLFCGHCPKSPHAHFAGSQKNIARAVCVARFTRPSVAHTNLLWRDGARCAVPPRLGAWSQQVLPVLQHACTGRTAQPTGQSWGSQGATGVGIAFGNTGCRYRRGTLPVRRRLCNARPHAVVRNTAKSVIQGLLHGSCIPSRRSGGCQSCLKVRVSCAHMRHSSYP